jgi:RNA polymerase sigma factor (sigma-70 family)
VRDDALADDLVQQTYEIALRKPPEPDREARPYLAKVLHNLMRMGYRSSHRRSRRHEVFEQVRELGAAPSEPAEELARRETYQLLERLVGELREPYRTVIALRFGEDLSAAEIARRLDLPASTVRSRLAQALDELRSDLDRHHGGDRRLWALALLHRPPSSLLPPAACSKEQQS